MVKESERPQASLRSAGATGLIRLSQKARGLACPLNDRACADAMPPVYETDLRRPYRVLMWNVATPHSSRNRAGKRTVRRVMGCGPKRLENANVAGNTADRAPSETGCRGAVAVLLRVATTSPRHAFGRIPGR